MSAARYAGVRFADKTRADAVSRPRGRPQKVTRCDFHVSGNVFGDGALRESMRARGCCGRACACDAGRNGHCRSELAACRQRSLPDGVLGASLERACQFQTQGLPRLVCALRPVPKCHGV